MSVVGDDLKWFSVQTGKQYKVDLHDISDIQEGLSTPSFRRPSSAGADPSKCFSVVFGGISSSLDMETHTVEDRDILVQCLRRIIDSKSAGIRKSQY